MNLRNLFIASALFGLGYVFAQVTLRPESTSFAESSERAQVAIDDTKAVATYANFCRVTGTPEEIILDYGLNSHPFGSAQQPIPVSQRIVLNFYTAKRMLQAVEATIQRHEAIFGPLETDVQKRVKSAAAEHAIPPLTKP